MYSNIIGGEKFFWSALLLDLIPKKNEAVQFYASDRHRVSESFMQSFHLKKSSPIPEGTLSDFKVQVNPVQYFETP